VSLSASDYGDFTRIMALYKLYYLLTYLEVTRIQLQPMLINWIFYFKPWLQVARNSNQVV